MSAEGLSHQLEVATRLTGCSAALQGRRAAAGLTAASAGLCGCVGLVIASASHCRQALSAQRAGHEALHAAAYCMRPVLACFRQADAFPGSRPQAASAALFCLMRSVRSCSSTFGSIFSVSAHCCSRPVAAAGTSSCIIASGWPQCATCHCKEWVAAAGTSKSTVNPPRRNAYSQAMGRAGCCRLIQ